MHEIDGVLEPSVIEFVEDHVRSLLAWDILAFFYRNPDSELDCDMLASALGRRADQIMEHVESLESDGILQSRSGQIRFRPSDELASGLDLFVKACEDSASRLALIALVLNRTGSAKTA